MPAGWEWAVLGEALISASICILVGIITRNLPLGPQPAVDIAPGHISHARSLSVMIADATPLQTTMLHNASDDMVATQFGSHGSLQTDQNRTSTTTAGMTSSRAQSMGQPNQATNGSARGIQRPSADTTAASGTTIASDRYSPRSFHRTATAPSRFHSSSPPPLSSNTRRLSRTGGQSSRDLLNTLRRQGAEGGDYSEGGGGGGRTTTMLPNSGRRRRRAAAAANSTRSASARNTLRRGERMASGNGVRGASTSLRSRNKPSRKTKDVTKRSNSARRVRSASPSVRRVERQNTDIELVKRQSAAAAAHGSSEHVAAAAAASERREFGDRVDESAKPDSLSRHSAYNTLPALHLMLPAPYRERMKAQKRTKSGPFCFVLFAVLSK